MVVRESDFPSFSLFPPFLQTVFAIQFLFIRSVGRRIEMQAAFLLLDQKSEAAFSPSCTLCMCIYQCSAVQHGDCPTFNEDLSTYPSFREFGTKARARRAFTTKKDPLNAAWANFYDRIVAFDAEEGKIVWKLKRCLIISFCCSLLVRGTFPFLFLMFFSRTLEEFPLSSRFHCTNVFCFGSSRKIIGHE